MKKITILSFILLTSFHSYSQVNDNLYSGSSGRQISNTITNSDFFLEVTPTYTFPTGKLSEVYNNGYGGLISLNQKLNSGLILFVEGGYVNFIGKEINIRVTSTVKNKTTTSNTSFTPPSFIHIPVSAGFKYYEDKFIIGVGIGTGISKLKDVDMESSTKLMINPMAGYDFGKVILGANYSITTIGDGNTNKYIGVRLSIKISE
jgi:hypothetical protein